MPLNKETKPNQTKPNQLKAHSNHPIQTWTFRPIQNKPYPTNHWKKKTTEIRIESHTKNIKQHHVNIQKQCDSQGSTKTQKRSYSVVVWMIETDNLIVNLNLTDIWKRYYDSSMKQDHLLNVRPWNKNCLPHDISRSNDLFKNKNTNLLTVRLATNK